MTDTITEMRVTKAKKAEAAARNPEFKNYWRKVAETLAKHIDD